MPVQKFKSFQEASEALWCLEPDAAYYESIKDFWDSIARLRPLKKYPRGITKFKSSKEAVQTMDNWLKT